jgi:uncharacterized protein YoxC
MNTIEILTVIFLLLASVLCIALIYYFKLITKSVQSIHAHVKALSFRVEPFVQSATELSEKLSDISEEAKSQLKISKSIVSDIRERLDIILEVESEIRYEIESAVMPIAKNVHALVKGVSAFWRSYRNR